MADVEEGIDIIKFFLGVMTLLTVFVAGFAVFNWSKAQNLTEEVESEERSYRSVKKIAREKEFLNQVARLQTFGASEKITSKDFGRFLQETAAELNLQLTRFRSVGSGGSLSKKGFTKQSYEFSIEKQRLDVIVAYLWYIQAVWRGLKVEELLVKKPTLRRDAEFPGWEAKAIASIFKAKD
ncbi:hypothetical protein ACFL59_06210 [Planctomycetota bacterium]